MKIDFFEKEVKKARDRFNQLFGAEPVCNIEERQTLILAVCWLGVLSMRIKNDPQNRETVKEFLNHRNTLNQYFKGKERRESDERLSVETSNGGRGSPDMSQLRKRLQSGATETGG